MPSHKASRSSVRRILVVNDHNMVRLGVRTLFVNEPWVGRRVGAVPYRKLGVRNCAEAASRAQQLGLVA